MARTRAAVLAGARQCIITHGSRKTTMVDVAATAGVAKATLYNHFRTKSEVFAALVESEVVQAGADTAELAATSGLPVALVRLAERLGEHPVVRRLAAEEPGVLAAVVLPEQAGSGAATWELARTSLTSLLPAGTAVEPVLRVLVSQLLWPAGRDELETTVALLLGAPAASAASAAGAGAPAAAGAATPAAEPAGVPAVVLSSGSTVHGLGFPTPYAVAGAVQVSG